MKKLSIVAAVVIFILTTANFAKAQNKIGYVNFQAVVSLMPEIKTIKVQVDTYSKQFTDQLAVMNTEYQTKVQAYQSQNATMTDAVRSAKQIELQDIQKRMQDYNNNAQQQVDAKVSELEKPVIDKARAAVTAVAKEKGYDYVLDSSQTTLLVSPPGDDIIEAVKTKLGLK